MQIVIPMSGIGNRFLKAGFTEPKPLIMVDGRPMIEHVISMFPGEHRFIFICNQEHLRSTRLRDVLTSLVPSGKIIGIEPHKHGPVYAVMQAVDQIDDTEPTIVNYCDFFQTWDYQDFKKTMETTACDGAIPCYKGFHPHLLGPNLYASCKVDAHNFLLEIREKHSFTPEKMDSWQSSGTYYFRTGQIMKKYFQETMDKVEPLNGEWYVSLVYNLLVQDHLKTFIYELDQFCQWGTPEDLQEYLYWSKYFHTMLSKSS